MEHENQIRTVHQIYSDFGTGNIPGVLSALTDDVSWFDPGYPDVPYASKRNGKDEVMQFFIEMAGTINFTQFVPQEFYADKDVVIAKGFFSGNAIQSGKPFETEWVMIWKFRSDKVYSYQAFVDTAKMSNAIH